MHLSQALKMHPRLKAWTSQIGLILALIAIVLLVNVPVISFEMFYPEQAGIYVANQQIVHFRDLLTIYLSPHLFEVVVPFFRPSGHFLMYQILAPLLGWHNLKAYIIVNLIFLALSGFCIIKLYALLFPRFKIGGYIAFSYFLMHPALSLSRLIVLHFEFAYVFFSLAGLYYFVLFCQKNLAVVNVIPNGAVSFRYFKTLLLAILLFAIAVTFKEPALMMGPIFFVYFVLTFYPVRRLNNKQAYQILGLLITVTLILTFYLLLAWPFWQNPVNHDVHYGKIIAGMGELGKFLFAVPSNTVPKALLVPTMFWRPIIFPWFAIAIVWGLYVTAFVMATNVFSQKSLTLRIYQRSVIFLLVGALLFLVLPIGWGMALPWHLSLTLTFVGLIMGFAVDFFLPWQNHQKIAYAIGTGLFLLVAFITLPINQANIQRYVNDSDAHLKLGLTKNAVLFPPKIKDQLNDQSLLVIADHQNLGNYSLGNTIDPLHFYHDYYPAFIRMRQSMFLKPSPYYNGTLFKFAYLLPNLQEEIYPFDINFMETVPDLIIYDWLSHGDNIFCFDYDRKGNWLNKTFEFKKALLAEQKKRNMTVNAYRNLPATALGGILVARNPLTSPNYKKCQYLCDKDPGCKGFTFLSYLNPQYLVMQCLFYSQLDVGRQKFCPFCEGFIKK